MHQVFIFILFVFIASMAYAGYSAAPWVPTRKGDADRILRLANIRKGEKCIDIGSGDGRLVFLAANDYNAEAYGIDVGIPQYIHAKIKQLFQKNRKHTHIIWGNLFTYPLHEMDVVIIYLLSKSYGRLRKKLEKELKPGTRVIVEAWPIKEWKPTRVDHPDKATLPLYVYTIGKSNT